MRSSFLRSAAAAVCLAMVLSIPADAGQIRVSVGGASDVFTQENISVNVGDHVVWIWAGGLHSVVSGNPGAATTTGDGKFRNTTSASGSLGSKFFWKVTGSGSVPYYCFPHAPDMAGTINIQGTPVSIADFRITEVEFAPTGGLDRVQITNLGSDTGFLEHYRVSSQSGVASTITGSLVTLTPSSRTTLHLGASGTTTSSNVYLPAHPELGTAGSFALYVPNTSSTGSTAPASLTDANQLVDYVEWGAAGQAAQPNQTPAVSAGFWNAGGVVETTNSLPNGGAGYSISFCGSRTDRGPAFWNISTPNFGTGAICTTPTRTATWGRIKSLYR
ncbi:MAG: plastocyanin/azurin family copper-binding protein [Candidatus Eisenbacteria bacterium]